LGSEGATDPERTVRLAEAAVAHAAKDQVAAEYQADAWITLGAALYRVGRCHEAIRPLEEAIQNGRGVAVPQASPFLAMAHHRLGDRDEARRWLDRLRDHQPSTDPARFWDELEIRLLRSEAEAVILYDPVFPEDPFAH
jgi:tetratricopeptide (TPR) repeat protein